MSKNQKSEISQGLLTSLHPIPIPPIPHNHCNTLKKAFYYEVNQESEWCISKATATRIVQELKVEDCGIPDIFKRVIRHLFI